MVEYWDLYDKNRNKLDKKVVRGDKLKAGEYHLVVSVWIRNNNGEFLISRRSITKTNPLLWETTGGSAISGETSIEAAIREVKEELGISLDKKSGKLIGTTTRYYPDCCDLFDVWLFESNISLNEITLQKSEVCSAKWATTKEIRNLIQQHKFDVNPFLDEVIK